MKTLAGTWRTRTLGLTLLQDAATIPSVYLCSIYSLYDIANLKEGQVRSHQLSFVNKKICLTA